MCLHPTMLLKGKGSGFSSPVGVSTKLPGFCMLALEDIQAGLTPGSELAASRPSPLHPSTQDVWRGRTPFIRVTPKSLSDSTFSQ